MNLHEYQAKQLFAEYGLPVSEGYACATPQEAAEAADKIGGNTWVVKAQVHAGGRGKAGGVKLVKNKEDAKAFAAQWLGKRLVTYQTDANGQPVSKILVESCTDIDKELYLGAVVDRSSRRIVFMASTEGGVDIEKVAHETPEKILKATIDPLVGAQPYQGRELAFQLGLQGQELLIRFELRIALDHHHQPGEGAGELVLGRFKLLELGGITDLQAAYAGSGIGHRLEGLLLVAGVALDGGHQIGDQIGAALILVFDLAPACLDLLIQGRNIVHAATGQAQQQGHNQQGLGRLLPE